MQQDLKFNICGIETSYYPNKRIEGLQERIDQAVTPTLMYASQYWADHLESGSAQESASHALEDSVRTFVTHRLLYWIEVFSLKGEMSMTREILRKSVGWANVCHFSHAPPQQFLAQKHELWVGAVISEALKFVNAFGYCMGQSVPHIYLSALPFSPRGSIALHPTHAAFQNTLSVKAGISVQWPASHHILGKHKKWVHSVAVSRDGTHRLRFR